jgi:ornithine--oxo-acid transaminase
MIQSDIPALSAGLAERLTKLAGGRIRKVFFTNTGSEGVESAIKFARRFTGRDWILYASGGFHGLTCGALSLMSNQWWREGFGPLLEHTTPLPFGDIEAVRTALKSGKYAAFIVEPIQGESGVILPPKDYFVEVQKLCDRYGTLLVCDEVQTGLYRTGTFLYSQQLGIEPDMAIIAKALSGGQVPVGALLMRSDICNSVYSSIDKSFVHASTFGENTLSMRAALTTLKVMDDEGLGERAAQSGVFFRDLLREKLGRFEMVKEVRGVGLFNAIEFQPPRSLSLKMLYASFNKLHPGLFGQMTVKTLYEEARMLCQMAGNNYNVIKLVPPLSVSQDQLRECVSGVERVCGMMVNEKAKFWTQGLKIGAKALSCGVSVDKEKRDEGLISSTL